MCLKGTTHNGTTKSKQVMLALYSIDLLPRLWLLHCWQIQSQHSDLFWVPTKLWEYLGTLMISRPTLSCSHWWKFVCTECPHDIIMTFVIMTLRHNKGPACCDFYDIVLINLFKILDDISYILNLENDEN